MNLKLKQGLENTEIYVPFEKRNVLGKFIDTRLYPHLYKIAPSLFDIVADEVKTKTTETNDISINDTKFGSGSDSKGKIA